jgi:Glycosyltransferase WbsX
MSRPYQIAAYYFPNYHPDPRNATVHGPGWTEWELVKRAVPRYPGQRQPRIPAWGYTDESDPVVMAQKIAAAANHGLDAFIFDWYWYNDGPFLERGLEQGFLKAGNNDRLKFAIMWANHNWSDIHPARLLECQTGDYRQLYPGAITRQTFETAARHVITDYFHHPAYWTIDGAPYFSFYDLPELVRSLGGFAGVRDALAWFRGETRAAGFPDLHLNQVYWSQGILPGEAALRQPGEMLRGLGFDSVTSYVWIHHVPMTTFPETRYAWASQEYLRYWDKIEAEIDLPYFPNATMGWDSSPRTVASESFINAGYPFTSCLAGNTPAAFKRALRSIRRRLDLLPISRPKILTINAWNEWTEGSYLEPDTHYGMGYLQAIRDTFSRTGR